MTEDEIFEFLKKQEEQMTQEAIFYVHYDPTSGKIVNFRNYLETTDTLPHMLLKENDLPETSKDFNIAKYRIKRADNGTLKLEDFIPDDISLVKIDDFIYEVPKVKCAKEYVITEPYDLLIEQDNILGQFRVKLSDECRDRHERQSLSIQKMILYVTAPSDPNVLYKTLSLTIGDLIQNEVYLIDFKNEANADGTIDRFDGQDANIFSIRYLKDYLHVDIRE